jgi:hypothetical protein
VAIEQKVLPRAPGQSTGEIRAKIRRLVKRLDPDALAQRRARAVEQRDLQLVETDDGTSHLSGVDLPIDAASAAFNRVNAIAAGLKTAGDRRGIGQLRADVYLALLSGTLRPTTDGTPCPTTDDTQPSLAEGAQRSLADGPRYPPVGAAHPSLADRGHQSPADPAHRPRAVPGSAASPATGNEHGWTEVDDAVADVIAQEAREQLAALSGDLPERHRELPALLAQAADRIAASLIDLKTGWCAPGHGHRSDREHGNNGYRVPAGMRRLVEHRDRRCCFPGCRRPVRRCDADHSTPHHRGGPTCPCNLAMLCRHHHRVKHTRVATRATLARRALVDHTERTLADNSPRRPGMTRRETAADPGG